MGKALAVAVVGLLVVLGYRAGRDAQPVDAQRSSQAEAPSSQATAPASQGMDQATFWNLIEETRKASDNNTGDQSSRLEERLSKLPPQAIVKFEQIRHQLDQRAYTYRMWGAAYVIEDGCSDDCFRDFRAYVISLGPSAYDRAIANPDSLASVAQDAETGDWENADDVAPDAYSSRTGNDFPIDQSDLSGRPAGTPFPENDIAALTRQYPKLAARFR